MLTDSRFDNIDFDSEDNSPIFRFYTRFFLISSEILTDFQDMIIKIDDGLNEKKAQKQARKLMKGEDLDFSVQNLFDFINKVCKHKVSNIHVKNHHAKIIFKDSSNYKKTKYSETINILKLNEILKSNNEIKFIEMPYLKDIITQILVGYSAVVHYYENKNELFMKFCEGYIVQKH